MPNSEARNDIKANEIKSEIKQDVNAVKKDAKDAVKNIRDYAAREYGDDIGDIRRDLLALKSDIASLSANLYRDGSKKINAAQDAVKDGFDTLRAKSADGLEIIDSQVQENPRRAIMYAFLAGIVANALLRRR